MELSTAASIISPLDLPWSTQNGIRVDLKRDDLIHPFISGNKWRKLKYNVLEARKLAYTEILTFGGAFSNHLLATACAAAGFGFKSQGIVRGESSSATNHMLSLCRLFGMQLHFISREEYREKESYAEKNFPKDKFFHVPEGGTNALAVQGVAELFTELNTQYDFIYTACGTGGTTAGLLHGLNEGKIDSILRSVLVLKGADHLEAEIQKLEPDTSKLELIKDYHFGGYAKTSPELLEFIKEFVSGSGILIEPVYTAKMLYAVRDHISKGLIPKNSRVLCIHTGGLTGLLSERYLQALLP